MKFSFRVSSLNRLKSVKTRLKKISTQNQSWYKKKVLICSENLKIKKRTNKQKRAFLVIGRGSMK